MTAAQLVQILGLEKICVSRMLSVCWPPASCRKTRRRRCPLQATLELTEQGRGTVGRINDYGRCGSLMRLRILDAGQQQNVALGLTAYAQALEKLPRRTKARCGKQRDDCARIPAGYDCGRIAQMHRRILCPAPRVRPLFSKVRSPAGWQGFLPDLDAECNPIWLAVLGAKIVGSVAIDGEDLEAITKRIYVGLFSTTAVGAAALADVCWPKAMAFYDRRAFSAVQLWTFSGFTPRARCMNPFGFTLHKEWQGDQWG